MVEKIRLQQMRVGEVLESVMDKMDDPAEWKGKWINIYFLQSGETFPGNTEVSSEAECVTLYNEFMDSCINELAKKGLTDAWVENFSEQAGRKVLFSEISHAIPMPVK